MFCLAFVFPAFAAPIVSADDGVVTTDESNLLMEVAGSGGSFERSGGVFIVDGAFHSPDGDFIVDGAFQPTHGASIVDGAYRPLEGLFIVDGAYRPLEGFFIVDGAFTPSEGLEVREGTFRIGERLVVSGALAMASRAFNNGFVVEDMHPVAFDGKGNDSLAAVVGRGSDVFLVELGPGDAFDLKYDEELLGWVGDSSSHR